MSKRRRPAPCPHRDVVERIDATRSAPSVTWRCRGCGEDFANDPRDAQELPPTSQTPDQVAAAAVQLLTQTIEAVGAAPDDQKKAWRAVHDLVAYETVTSEDLGPLLTVLASTAATLLVGVVVEGPQRRGEVSTPLKSHEEVFLMQQLAKFLSKVQDDAARGLRDGNLRRPS